MEKGKEEKEDGERKHPGRRGVRSRIARTGGPRADGLVAPSGRTGVPPADGLVCLEQPRSKNVPFGERALPFPPHSNMGSGRRT